MEYKDYYQILGVPKTASQAEIKKAYRRLARQLHPDRNPDDATAEQRFKEANEAHAVLSNPEQRKRYDELGANWQTYQQYGGQAADDWAGAFGGAPFGSYQSAGPGGTRFTYRQVSPDEMSGFSDFFRAFFGGAPGGAGGAGGARSAGAGSTRSSGGFEQLFDFGDIGERRGTTQTAASRGADVRAEAEVSLAEVARGATRMVNVDGRRLEVTIPPGVADGARIKLRGAGMRGAKASAGDLYVTVRIRPDEHFERRGADLVTELPITLAEAMVGAEVPVPTPTGTLKLRIRPNTQNGQEIHLAGKGLPRPRRADAPAARGDLVVRVRVVLPHLDDETREEMANLLARHPQPDPRRPGRTH